METIAFRADGGANIGMGHIMRCLSLAKEFRNNGFTVHFISKINTGIDKIKEAGFDVIPLQQTQNIISTQQFNYGSSQDLDKEAQEIIKAIKTHNIDLLFIDTYNVTRDYFLKIKPHVKYLGYIDDLNAFVYPVDILINGNITAQYMDYKKYHENQILLLGPKYNLIRDEFRNLPNRTLSPEAKEIMITTGGSDPYNMSTKITQMILKHNFLNKLSLNVIVGKGFKNLTQLKHLAQTHKNITLHQNVKEMSEIMLKSDIAISAGGSTLYELCACGTPTLAFIYAKNQEAIVNKMEKLRYIQSLGWFHQLNPQKLQRAVLTLITDYNLRKTLSKRMQSLVDAKGTKRIVEKVASLIKTQSLQ